MKDRRELARLTLKALRRLYPEARCELDFKNPLQLAVATILSAQCTDKRVNIVTRALFSRYRSAKDYAAAAPAELEGLVRSTGFYRAKARSIRELAAALVRDHGGEVPDSMEELLKLRGVARKTANVILGSAFGKAEGVVVDTHVKRVAYRIGLTDDTDPVKIERCLMALAPRASWIFLGHGLVWHGRRVCRAKDPACPDCLLRSFCARRGLGGPLDTAGSADHTTRAGGRPARVRHGA